MGPYAKMCLPWNGLSFWLVLALISSTRGFSNTTTLSTVSTAGMLSVRPLPYRLPSNSIPRSKIALLITATGPYITFYKNFIASANAHVFRRHDVRHFLFTDIPAAELAFGPHVTILHAPARGFPDSSLLRFSSIVQASASFKDADYVFAFDVDMYFLNDLGDEMLGSDLVGVLHPDNAFYRGDEVSVPPGWTSIAKHPGKFFIGLEPPYHLAQVALDDAPFETRNESRAACLGCQRYFAGGVFGGRRAPFMKMVRYLAAAVDDDSAKGVVALVHDESFVNYYFNKVVEPRVMSLSYVYPDPLGSFSTMDMEHPRIWVDNNTDPNSGVRWFVPHVINLRKDKASLFETRVSTDAICGDDAMGRGNGALVTVGQMLALIAQVAITLMWAWYLRGPCKMYYRSGKHKQAV